MAQADPRQPASLHSAVCPDRPGVRINTRLRVSHLLHAVHVTDQGCPDLQGNRHPARGPAAAEASEDGQHGAVPRCRHRRRVVAVEGDRPLINFLYRRTMRQSAQAGRSPQRPSYERPNRHRLSHNLSGARSSVSNVVRA